MGQAYDEQGRVLGSATGKTKQDVFNELNAKYPDAAQIVIRHLGERGATGDAHKASPLDEMRAFVRKDLALDLDAKRQMLERELAKQT